MRKGLAAFLLACVLLGIGWYLLSHSSQTRHGPSNPTPPTAPLSGNPLPAAVASTNLPPPAAGASLAPAAIANPVVPSVPSGADYSPELLASTPSSIPPATILENVRTAVRQYGSQFGGNPVGTNPEITSALNGGNPKQARFLNPEAGMRINAKGELIDPWGTPYFFHQLSGTDMEVRSAGQDKRMWTADDLATR